MTGLHTSRKTSNATPDTAAQTETTSQPKPDSDNVVVSPRARLLKMGHGALQEAPEIRPDVVEAARVKLKRGADVHDGGEIARAMIETISAVQGDAGPMDPQVGEDA
jgi:anti-sigma28 factor (negative regulator of flagellin synthesis)